MSKEERDPCEDCPFADTNCPGGAWCVVMKTEEERIIQ